MKDSTQFDVIFDAELVEGYEADSVKQNLSKTLKIPAEKVERLFCGKEVAIKRNLSKDMALQYQKQFRSLGTILKLRANTPKVADTLKVTAKAETPKPEKVTLALVEIDEPVQAVRTEPEPEPEPATNKHITARSFLSVSSIGLLPSLLFILLSLFLLFAFMPYPEIIIKKGFVIGIMLSFFSAKRFRNKLIEVLQ